MRVHVQSNKSDPGSKSARRSSFSLGLVAATATLVGLSVHGVLRGDALLWDFGVWQLPRVVERIARAFLAGTSVVLASRTLRGLSPRSHNGVGVLLGWALPVGLTVLVAALLWGEGLVDYKFLLYAMGPISILIAPMVAFASGRLVRGNGEHRRQGHQRPWTWLPSALAALATAFCAYVLLRAILPGSELRVLVPSLGISVGAILACGELPAQGAGLTGVVLRSLIALILLAVVSFPR